METTKKFVSLLVQAMIATFDVFRIEADGSVKWFGAFTDIEAAHARIQELLRSSSGKYFIFSQTTGNKLFFNQQRRPNSADEYGKASPACSPK
jgi:hypothetical protein